MSHNRKVLKTATNELGKAKAPAKPIDKPYSQPIVSSEGYKQGPPPSGSHYRIPGNGESTSIYNPTPYPLNLVGPNGTQAQIGPWDTDTQNFNEPYMDEYPQDEEYHEGEYTDEEIEAFKAGGYVVEDISVPSLTQAKKGGSLKKYSKNIEATNKLLRESELLKKTKSKKKKIFDPSSNYFDIGGIPNLPLREGREAYERLSYTDNDRMAMAENGGFLPEAQTGKTVKKKSPYQLQEEARKKAGQSKYDMLETNKPQVSENTKPKNIPIVDKNITAKALNQKNLERQATSQAIKNQPTLSEQQKTEILMDPRKLDEYQYLNNQQDPGTIQKSIPQSGSNRAWEYMTNPFTAAEYAISGGGAENMPHNINEMRMVGIDPGVVQGRNLVGNTLNSSLNLFDAGDKVARNVGEGNYGTAALEALRFIPGSGLSTGLIKKGLKNIDGKKVQQLGKQLIDEGYPTFARKLTDRLSPLNLIPGYGSKLKGSTVPLGNILEDVVQGSNVIAPKNKVMTAINAVTGRSNAPGVISSAKNSNRNANTIFSAKIDPSKQGTNLSFSQTANPLMLSKFRNSKKLQYNLQNAGRDATEIPLLDPAVSLHRRLPFSNKYVSVDPQKLMNNKFQWSTTGTGAQNLAEKYGSGALGLAGLTGVGFAGMSALQGVNPIDTYSSINPETGNTIGEDVMNDYKKETDFKKYASRPDPYFMREIGTGAYNIYDNFIEPNLKKKGGPIEMELDDDMIQYLLSQGYDIEDID
jgi:hypothetical protein